MILLILRMRLEDFEVKKHVDLIDDKFQSFLEDLKIFNYHISDLDRRLGTLIAQAFDDCTFTESAFKLVAMFGPFLER